VIVPLLIVVVMLVCAFQAMRSPRLLIAALWLAGTSALVALLIFLLGAPELAVIELSVGAGLVTILFVFAINIAGDESIKAETVVPKPLVWIAVLAAVVLLGWFSLPAWSAQVAVASQGLFTKTLWEERGLDTLLQLIFVFAGVLGVLALLAEGHFHPKKEDKS
jgi:uncharacterized MnhB-related membrane protein